MNKQDKCKMCGGIGDVQPTPLIEVDKEPSVEPICNACRVDMFPEFEKTNQSDQEYMLELRDRNGTLEGWNTNLRDSNERLRKEVLALRQSLRASVMSLTVTDKDKMAEDYYFFEPISKASKARREEK